MAMAGRLRSTLPLFQRIMRSDSLSSTQRSTVQRSLLCPTFTNPEFSKNYATASPPKDQKIKVPLTLFGVSGNYASALYLSAVKANTLDKVESELIDFVEASKRSSTFSQFMKDLSVPGDTRIKAIKEICAGAKFYDITNNFLAVLAENGRLRHLESIAKKFTELTMAHRGEMKAIVTTVILQETSKVLPLLPEKRDSAFLARKRDGNALPKRKNRAPKEDGSLPEQIKHTQAKSNLIEPRRCQIEANREPIGTLEGCRSQEESIWRSPEVGMQGGTPAKSNRTPATSNRTPESRIEPLPAEEEKELKETLQDIIGHGKKVNLEQKIDPSILGGLVVEFGQKVFDMSIKTRARQMERFLRVPVNLGSL